jgi:hypothetical protein
VDIAVAEFREVAEDKKAQQVQELVHLIRRTRPIFRAEAEQREVLDALACGEAHSAAKRLDTTPMALAARQSARDCPSSVPVHDDPDMAGNRNGDDGGLDLARLCSHRGLRKGRYGEGWALRRA